MEEGDAFGHMLLDYLEGRSAREVIERDDGFVDVAAGPAAYFEPPARWPRCERRALRLARGRVLDVGAGAGRVALELEARGREVVAIDVSPAAVEVCRRRGVTDARLLGISDVDESLGPFDTVVMFGNNSGVLGDPAKATRLLRRLHAATTGRGRILAASSDPYATEDPLHLAYHERNRGRGRAPGQLRFRVRHRGAATPYFDYLIVSRDEMAALAAEAGWRLARTLDCDERYYVGVLEKA